MLLIFTAKQKIVYCFIDYKSQDAALPYFNFAMIGECPKQAVMVEEYLRQCVETVQEAFFYDKMCVRYYTLIFMLDDIVYYSY